MNQKQIDDCLAFLVSPDDGSPLIADASYQFVFSQKSKQQYPLKDGIPYLLPQAATTPKSASTALHQDAGSSFDYIDHYIQDAEHFDYFQEIEDPAMAHENRRLHETILTEIPSGIKNILDIGCGKAWIAEAMEKRNVKTFSLDISIKNVKKALAKYPRENHLGVVGDLFSLPFKAGSFDCIICSEVIEHVHSPGKLIQILINCLAPGGKLIITTPNEEKIVYHQCVHCNHPTPEDAHLHSFSKAKLLNIVAQLPVQISEQNAYTFSNIYAGKLKG